MRSHNANIVQSLKFRIKKYRQNLYSGKNETKTTPKIKEQKVWKENSTESTECSIIQQNAVRFEGDE